MRIQCRIDGELLRNGEQREIQKIVSRYSDRSTGNGWWTRRTGVPGTGGKKAKAKKLMYIS
jgi:hypothetical protein